MSSDSKPARLWLSPPDVGPAEREALVAAFDSGWIAPLGPDVNGFEADLAAQSGVGHCAALSSGTAAIQLALELVGVRPGDLVLAPTLTFVATVNPITYVGAKPVLVDSEERTWGIDPELVDQELTRLDAAGRRVGAVIAVDLLGQCADYDALESVCARHEVPLVEDAAEALGASWNGRPAGSFGRAGILSFNGNKIITTSGGGALLSDDEALIARARFLATQARDPAPHYQHSSRGYNFRMSNLLAALGRAQLAKIDQKVARRRAHFDAYAEALGGFDGVAMMPEDPRGHANRWLTCIQVDPEKAGVDRENLRLALADQNIESRPLWKPMHLQPLFADTLMVGGAVSERLFERGLCLPSGSGMTDADRQRVIDSLVGALSG